MTHHPGALDARYRALFETTPDGIMIVDDAGTYVDVNDAMCAMLGAPRTELVGRHFRDFIPPDRLDEAIAAFAALQSEGAMAVEFPLRRVDGSIANFEWRSRSNFLPGLHFCIARDVAARDAAQRALRDSEERYRAFVANSSEAIWRFELDQPVPTDIDPDAQIDLYYQHGYLAECNDLMAQMYGFERSADLVGARLGDLLVRDNPDNLDYLRAFIASGYRLIGVESREVDRDGNEKDFVNNLVAVIDRGHVVRAWGTQRDVSDQRRTDRERAALVAELQQANRAKDDFLAMLSHELRTPMTAMLGWASMLQNGALDATLSRTAADAIVQATRAQAHLIDDLLDVSRIVSGKMQLTLEPLLLADAVDAAIDTVRPAADAKEIEIAVLRRDEVRLLGDSERLQQVFWNLVSNAVKFAPRHSRVTLEVLRDADSARVIVRDTGEGIDAELLPVIFDRFRQGDSGASRKFGGLGLGLSIARNLVELHGGTVTAASAGRGHGAEFTVTLPMSADVRDDTRSSRAESESLPLDGLSLLVVEDDPATRKMLEIALRRFGAEVTSAAGAGEAFDALTAGRFDVLVSDIGLPGEDGCAMMVRIRDAKNAIRAIALTAYASNAERDRALACGFQRWLAKPVDPAVLAEEVRSVASSDSRGRERR